MCALEPKLKTQTALFPRLNSNNRYEPATTTYQIHYPKHHGTQPHAIPTYRPAEGSRCSLRPRLSPWELLEAPTQDRALAKQINGVPKRETADAGNWTDKTERLRL